MVEPATVLATIYFHHPIKQKNDGVIIFIEKPLEMLQRASCCYENIDFQDNKDL